ncbi:hypothetical protein Tco_0652861 [Tanacetum coccineum]|uniref:Uncharacterized protein n=1 Tax=Tanacetum coccineum TaxID=301880 RepID=A0ABQ4WYS1_9ASTR
MPMRWSYTMEQTQLGVSYDESRYIFKVFLRIILVILPELRVNSFTMKMEILDEPTSNKLMVGVDWSPEFQLSHKIHSHMLITTVYIRNHESSMYMFQDLRYSDTTHLSKKCRSVKVKEFQERCNIKSFSRMVMSMSVQKSKSTGLQTVRVSQGCGMRLVVDKTAKGAFCFGLDPHRVRLAATAARDVWLAVLTAERVFVLVRWTATHKGAFWDCLSHAKGPSLFEQNLAFASTTLSRPLGCSFPQAHGKQ